MMLATEGESRKCPEDGDNGEMGCELRPTGHPHTIATVEPSESERLHWLVTQISMTKRIVEMYALQRCQLL